jgi:TolB protein
MFGFRDMIKKNLLTKSFILLLALSSACLPTGLTVDPDTGAVITDNTSSTTGKLIFGYVGKVKEYDISQKTEKELFAGDQPDIGPNGEIVYVNQTFPGQNMIVKAMNPTYTSARVIFDGQEQIGGSVYDPEVSPDGKYVAMTITSWNSPNYTYKNDGVLVYTMDGQFKAMFDDKYTPSWTPDGRLAMAGSFGTNRSDGTPGVSKTPGLYISDKELKELTRIDPELNDPVPYQPSVSPDGKRIAFILNSHVWVMDIDGKNMKQLTAADNDNQESYPAWSPDGKYIAAWSFKTFEESYYTAIAVVPSDLQSPLALKNDAPVWPYDNEGNRVSGGSKQLVWE